MKTLFLVSLLIAAPLLPRWPLLLTYPIWVAVISAFVLLMSQPSVSNDDLLKKDSKDQRSALYIHIAGVLIYIVPVLDYAYGREARPELPSPFSILGLAMIVGGLSFRIFSIRTLGRWFTSVVRVQEGQQVIDRGPYKFLRHPSYLGAFVMALGISVLFRSYAGLLVCFFIFFPVYMFRIRAEEETLKKELGEPYLLYQKKTWKMVPFVY